MMRPQQRNPSKNNIGSARHVTSSMSNMPISSFESTEGYHPITLPATHFYHVGSSSSSSSNKDDHHKHNGSSSSSGGMGRKVLYNRKGDVSKLVSAYKKRKEQPQLVLLVGQPGNGKTTLGHSLRPYVARDHGYFATGRFDPLDYPEPYGPLLEICEQFLRALMRPPTSEKDISSSLRQQYQQDSTTSMTSSQRYRRQQQQEQEFSASERSNHLQEEQAPRPPSSMMSVYSDDSPTAASYAALPEYAMKKDFRKFSKALQATVSSKEIQALCSIWPDFKECFRLSSVPEGGGGAGPGSSGAAGAGAGEDDSKHSSGGGSSKNGKSTTTKSASSAPLSNKSKHSLMVSILQFLRAMARVEKPLVILVDDLHFADKASLEVLKLALMDPKINSNLFCMVAFRPVNVQHPSSIWLQTLEKCGTTTTTTNNVGAGISNGGAGAGGAVGGIQFLPIVPSPITDIKTIQEWINKETEINKLKEPFEPALLASISETISKETKGNACSIEICLKIMMLNDEIVRKTGGTPLQAGGDVKSLFQLLFLMLSPICQKTCWTASCMGMVIDIPRMKRIIGEDLLSALEEAERFGILQYIRPFDSNGDGTSDTAEANDNNKSRENDPGGYYVFANITYRDCVYGLISPKDRNLQHTAIGNIYRQDIDKVGVYRVVAHLSLGRDLLSPKQVQAFARICLTAGDLSAQWGEFQSAARHYDSGLDLLDNLSTSTTKDSDHQTAAKASNKKSKWKTDYQLTLSLYNGSAAVYSSLGDYEEMEARLAEVLNNAKDTVDKITANTIQVKSLVAQTRHADAIELGLKILPKLEEHVKKYSSESELKATRKLLEGKSEERILSSPPMVDDKKIGALEIMNALMESALIEDGDLIVALACRIVKATLRYGLNSVSPVGMCMLGALLCFDGDIDDGVWCSNVGLEILEMSEDQSCKGRVMAIHWGLLVRFVQPIKSCQEPLKRAYRLCVESGDNDFAMISPIVSAFNMVVVGGPLAATTEAMKSLYQLLHKKNQDSLLRIIRPFFQMSLNLLGASTETDPTILTGSIMVEEDDYAYAMQTRNPKIEYCILLCQSMLSFYLHKFENARLLMEKCIAIKEPGILLSTLDIQLCFFDAMTAIGQAWVWIRKMDAQPDMDKKERKHLTEQKSKLVSAAERCLGKLRIYARYSPDNLTQRVHIIQAELNAMNGNVDEADKLFQKAMQHAEEHGQLSDRALACERAGLAMRSCGKEMHALDYLEDCCAMYRQWGALIKVNHVKGNVIPQAIYEWDT